MKNPILLNNSDLLKLSREFLEKGTSIRFQAKGWSMRPFIRDGDFITVSPIENSSIRIGDVVFYSTAENNVIVHRIINKYGKDGNMNLLIKGDAGFGPPERVNSQDVLGKVVAIKRNGRERNLDTKFYRIIGLFFAGLSPFSQWTYPIGSKVKHKGRGLLVIILVKLQSLKLYGFLAKKLMKENICYKIATPSDADSVSRFYMHGEQHKSKNPTDTLKEQLKNPEDSGYWLVAKQEDMVIGGVTLTKFQESDYPYEGWWLFGMKVKLRYRRMGIGEKLTKMAADVAAKHGALDIKLLVFEDAKPANNLYQKLGFRQISIPELNRQLEKEAQENSRRRIIFLKDVKRPLQSQNKTTLINGRDFPDVCPFVPMP
jgi:ribosomal protein S18 acetylase RimI-like enzyme